MTGKELVTRKESPELKAGRAFLLALKGRDLTLCPPGGGELSEEQLEQIGDHLFRIQGEIKQKLGLDSIRVNLNTVVSVATHFWDLE